ALPESLELLPEIRPRLVEPRGAVRLDANAEWTDGASDEHRPVGFVRRFARDLRRRAIDLADLRLESVLDELGPIGAEAVRLEDLRARLRVRAMDLLHEVGRAQAELVVALVDEHAFGIEHRAHRAVEHDNARRVHQAFDRGARAVRERARRRRACRAHATSP